MMEECENLIRNTYSELIKDVSKFQLSDNVLSILEDNKKNMDRMAQFVSTMKTYTRLIDILLAEYNDHIDERIDELTHEEPKDNFVFTVKNGILSYKTKDFIPAERKTSKLHNSANDDHSTSSIANPERPLKIEKTFISEVDYAMNMPVVTQLDQIKPMMCYYKNPDDKRHTSGVYMCIIPGVYVKMPFPQIIDSTKVYNRAKSIRCKYLTKKSCDEKRRDMADRHNSEVRICNYAHHGDKIVKIGHPSRCVKLPRLGNCDTLKNDIVYVEAVHIKNILLYGLNDIFTAAMWLDYKNIHGVIDDVEYA